MLLLKSSRWFAAAAAVAALLVVCMDAVCLSGMKVKFFVIAGARLRSWRELQANSLDRSKST